MNTVNQCRLKTFGGPKERFHLGALDREAVCQHVQNWRAKKRCSLWDFERWWPGGTLKMLGVRHMDSIFIAMPPYQRICPLPLVITFRNPTWSLFLALQVWNLASGPPKVFDSQGGIDSQYSLNPLFYFNVAKCYCCCCFYCPLLSNVLYIHSIGFMDSRIHHIQSILWILLLFQGVFIPCFKANQLQSWI